MASNPNPNNDPKSDTERLPKPSMKPDTLEPRILLSGTWVGPAAEPVDGATDDADTFQGDSGRDIAHGLDGDDVLYGDGGNDQLFGDEGDDDLFGGAGRDRLDGGEGEDELHGGDGNDQARGGDGNDTIMGGSGNDLLLGGDGDDQLDGQSGRDTLRGEFGNDYLSGGDGVDRLYGGDGEDHLFGGSGNDLLKGDAGTDVLDGGDGNDNLFGGQGNDSLQGDAGNDRLTGDAGDDSLSGGEGNDRLTGGAGEDALDGGGGNDILRGGGDDDVLDGQTGADTLRGDGGDDSLSGGEGTDKLFGGSGDDTLDGGSDNDILSGDAGDDSLSGGEGDDRLRGGSGDDVLAGDEGNDRLEGGAGDDTLAGGAGNDLLIGGRGFDVADYRDAPDAIQIDLTLTTAQDTLGAGTDTLRAVEGVVGSEHDDTFAFARPRVGAVYHVDGHGGSNTIDLSNYDSSQVTWTEDTIKVQTRANGRGFEIQYENIDTILLADQAVDQAEVLPPELAVTDATGYEDRPIPLSIDASLADSDGDGNETLAVTIRGVPDGATLSAGFDNGDGSWTLAADELDGLTITPTENMSGTIDLTIEATSAREGVDQAASVSQTLQVDVLPVVDTPTLDALDATGAEDTSIALDISAQLGDSDGSESMTLRVSGVPDGAMLSAGMDNGDGSWTLSSNEVAGLTITPPEDFSGSFDLTVEAVAQEYGAVQPTVNFADHDILGYGGGQDQNAAATVEDDGSTLHLTGNGWKKIDFPYDVTPDTVLEFEFLSSQEGEIHGIGLDSDDQISADQTFKLLGTQDWGHDDFNTYNSGGGWQQFRIPVGQFFTGQQQNLFFVNDHDVNDSTAESLFRNVRVFDESEAIGGATASVSEVVHVTVTPEADAPTLTVADIATTEDSPIPLDIDVQLGDVDGSEKLSITVSGVPEGASLSAGSDNGDGSWTLTHQQLDELTLTPAPDFSGTFELSVEATAMEYQAVQQSVNFDEYDTESYGQGQDLGGQAIVEDGGDTLRLEGNTWKKINFPYDVTSETVLEFDFLSTHEGEIHGIGFDTDDGYESDRTFKLLGTQAWGRDDFEIDDLGGDWQRVRIPVGQYYTGPQQNLFFVNDHDVSGSQADSSFRNVRVFEQGETDVMAAVGPAATVTQTMQITVAPEADAPTLVVDNLITAEDTAVPLRLSAQLSDVDGSEELSITVHGVPQGASLSAGTDNGDGSWSLSSADLNELTFTPPKDFSGHIGLSVEATATETANGHESTSREDFRIEVTPTADAPELWAGDAEGLEDTAISLDVAAQLSDLDGSELLSLRIAGVPQGASLSAGIDNGDGSWTLTPNELDKLTIIPPRDFHGSIELSIEATSTESSNADTSTVSRTVHVEVASVDDFTPVDPNVVAQQSADLTPTAQGIEDDDIWTDEDLARLVDEISQQALGSGPANTGSALLLVDQLDLLDTHSPIDETGTAAEGFNTLELVPMQHESADLTDEAAERHHPLHANREPIPSNAGVTSDNAATSRDAVWPSLSSLWGALRAFAGTRRGPTDRTLN